MAVFTSKAETIKRALSGAALALLLAAPVQAEQPSPSPSPSAAPSAGAAAAQTLNRESFAKITENEKELIDQRTRAEQMLKADPKDYKAHLLLGYVMHRAEGDLPRARYHLEQALKICAKKANQGEKDAQELYFVIGFTLDEVLTQMGQSRAELKLLRKLASNAGNSTVFVENTAWPLFKLGKEKEARQAIQMGLNSDDLTSRVAARNTLGCLESYYSHHKAAYDAYSANIKEITSNKNKFSFITFYNNLGSACMPLGRYEEAEKNMSLAASQPFCDTTYSNPYRSLTEIYLGQARFSEAINALNKAQRWSRAVKPFLYQQSMARDAQIKGLVYLELGLPEEAVDSLNWLVKRPDRYGINSGHVEQGEAGNQLCWRTALQTNLQRNQERLAATDFKSGCLSLLRFGWQRLVKGESTLSPDAMYFSLVWNNLRMRRQIYQAGKRIAALAASKRFIRNSMLPYDDQSVNTPEWYRPNLIGVWGTGVSETAIKDIQAHPPEQYEHFKPFITNLQGEAAFLKGRYSRSAELFRQALQGLPKQEALLRLRTETRLAMALQKCGREDEALSLLQHVISSDGAILREVGARIPVIPQISTSVRENGFDSELLQGLKRSPRFKVGSSGLRLLITSLDQDTLRVTFNDAGGNSVKSFSVSLSSPRASLSETALAGIHDGLCAPNVSRSGLDDSIDASNSSINARSLLKYR